MMYLVHKHTKEHRRYNDAMEWPDADCIVVGADDDGWIEWQGEECPLPEGAGVQVKTSIGIANAGPAGEFRWTRQWRDGDIIAYRPILYAGNRPEPQEWDGEGLPPVGVAVEYRDAAIPCDPNDWRECILLARFGEWLCVVEHKHGDPLPHVCSVDETRFRPIRSEKDRTIDQIMDDCGVARCVACTIYEAGYRKQGVEV